MGEASHRVISTPELLEIILLQLDMRTLLTSAQLVSRTWHGLITKSSRLQKALFFLPDTNSKERTKNPLLAELFPQWFPSQRRLLHGSQAKTIKKLPLAYHLDAYMRVGASWRRMLIHQPPIYELGLVNLCRGQGGGNVQFGTVRREDGLRMDTLYDKVLMMATRDELPFWLLWRMIPESLRKMEAILAASVLGHEVVLYTGYFAGCKGSVEVERREREWLEFQSKETRDWKGGKREGESEG